MAAPVPVVIRPFAHGDRPALYDLLAEIWPDRTPQTLDARWWWSRDPSPLMVAQDPDGALAGVCAHIPFTLRDGGRDLHGAWVVDFFVCPSRQGQGIGGRLVAALAERFGLLASLNQTEAAWGAFRRAGWRERSLAPMYLAPDSRAARLLASLQRRPHPRADMSVGPPVFDAAFQEFWLSVRDRLPPASLRDAATLDARFARSGRGYALLSARLGGQLRGYAVARVLPPGSIRSFAGHRVALVADHLVDPGAPGVFADLVQATAGWAATQGVRFVLCMAVDPAHRRVLRRAGFLGPDTPLVGRRLGKLAVGFTATSNAPGPPWHLTPLDCDVDLLFDGGG